MTDRGSDLGGERAPDRDGGGRGARSQSTTGIDHSPRFTSALRHKARGRRSNRALSDELKTRVLVPVREIQSDFGPTLRAETLEERHWIGVSRETLRIRLSEAGPWLPRRQRRSVHRLRLRREHLVELVQTDGSEHRWFEDRGPPALSRCSSTTRPVA